MSRACVVVVAVVAIGLLTGSNAHAEPTTPTAAMEDYFAGEKTGGLVLGGMGIGGLVAGGLLFRSSKDTHKGASYSFLTLGVLHLAAGIYIHVASNGRIDTFRDEIREDSAAWVKRERVRMKGVSTQFTVLKIVEVALIAGGLTMAGIGYQKARPKLQGAGIALAIEAALTLGFDIWAARRASNYRDDLATFDVAASLDGPSGAPVALVTHTFTF